jgi:long-chain acyl-CoA synthetase
MNIAQLLDETAKKYPTRKAIIFDDKMLGKHEVTYAELSMASSLFAGSLKGLGITPGDRVALHLPNLPQFVIAIWGAFKAGAIPTPMNPQLKRREITYQLKDSSAKMIIGLTHLLEEVEAAVHEVQGVQVVTVGAESPYIHFDQLLQGQPHFVDRKDDDIALQPYTSGTTGKPKGVLLTHGNLISNVINVQKIVPLAPEDDRVLIPIPMFHITGMTVMMLAPLTSGATIYPMLRWDAEFCFELIQKYKISNFLSVPTIYIDMLHHPKIRDFDLSSLEICASGGARMPVPIMEAFEKNLGIKIYEGFGLTETSPVTHTNLAAPKRLPGSIGFAIADTECRIVDEKGKQVPPGLPGELLIRGPQVMKGYHNNPEATRAAIDPDGFFHTGDLATVDKEGYYYIVDRVKDMVNVGGLNVYPKEVEHVLYEHAAVAECAVVGVPDERKGETVKAFIVLKKNYEPTDALAEEIKLHCLNSIAAYKHPRHVEFVTALPKTGSGKIQKYLLKEKG